MLNRIFVLIGIVVILAIGAAFVVPRFIQWGDYRGRLQTMAAEAFGTEVAIGGDIQLTLLPEPKLEFSKVRVGTVSAPVLEVDKVEASFSLVDFLRDQYKVTGLRLERPVVNVMVSPDGRIASGLAIAGHGQSNVSIANADVSAGSVRLIDGRSGKIYTADGISGQVRMEALEGPFSFQGTANVDHAGYGVRIGTGRFDANGTTTLSLYVKASDDSFTLESNGSVTAGEAPKYAGDLTYRRPPPKAADGNVADAGRGDFVLTGKVEAGPERLVMTNYVMLPDENRAATRLTGAAELKVGKATAFNAIVSGGVVALPPRDATKELSDPPYELVRLLSETPLPMVPDIPGTVGLDIAELNLRAVSLRDLHIDAATDTKGWTIRGFDATLPGNTRVTLSGNLKAAEGKPVFAGSIILSSQQLDRLAALWRKPAAGNPLFNKAGSLSADVVLSADTLALSSGTVVVGGINQGFDAEIGFGAQRQLKLGAHFTTLGDEESAAFAALLPDVTGGGSFVATFPKGQLDLSASKAVLFGLEGTDLVADATWEGGVLEFSRLAAGDFGGASFDGKLTAFGTLAKPELSGSGTLKVDDDAPIVGALLGAIKTPPAVADFLRQSLPAAVDLQLDAPSGDGGQNLTLTGKLATADTKLEAKLGAGIANMLTAPLSAQLALSSDSALLMTRQLGFGASSLFGSGTPLRLEASVEGTPSKSYDTQAMLSGGNDHIGFSGNVIPGDYTKISGTGQLDVKLDDPAVVAEALGAGGLYLPAIEGTADFAFAGADSMTLSRIQAGPIRGDLALTRNGSRPVVTGTLNLAALDAHALVPALAGVASTVSTAGSLWPEGPIDIGSAPRSTDGRVDVNVASVSNGATTILSNVGFGFDWDAQSVHLRNFRGAFGPGTFGLDATVCCSGGDTGKQLSGRVTINGVPLETLAPPAVAADLSGTVDASGQFNGSGETLQEAVAALTGTGSYSVSGFAARHFDPSVFRGVSGLSGVVDMSADDLSSTIMAKVAAGDFEAPSLAGSFTIAGGVLRSPNLAIVGSGARIFGGANLALRDLTLDARYSMSPTQLDDAGAVDPTSAEIDAVVTGPLWAPVGRYDVGALVEGMKIKASEAELARLEKLKAESEARMKAASELQSRLTALRSVQTVATGGAARTIADAAAARKAADDLAAKARAAVDAASQDLGM